MESANKSPPPPRTTSAALSGKTEPAPNVPRDGTSTPTMSVSPSAISAQPGMTPAVPANPATTATKLRLEPASPTTMSVSSPTAIFSAKPGLDLPASNALIEPSLTLMESAPQSAHFATPSTRPQETASPASKDMIFLKESVLTHLPTLPSLPIWDAENGTGKTKNVCLAPRDGLSTMREFASLSLISAQPTTTLVSAHLATKVMT